MSSTEANISDIDPFLVDGLQSTILNSSGGNGSLNARLTPTGFTRLGPRQQSNLYQSAWMIRTVIDLIAEDMCREGWYVNHLGSASPEAQLELTRRMNKPYFRGKICESVKNARTFGGAALVADLQDGQLTDMPVNLESLTSIGKLRALDKTWVFPHGTTQMFDLIEPEYYVVSPSSYEGTKPSNTTYKWHESRILRFDGLHLPFTDRQQNQGWGASLIDVLYDPWQKINEIETHIITAIERLSVFIHSIKGLTEFARKGQLPTLQKYLDKIHQQLIHTNTLVLDADIESGQFVSRSVGGLDSLYSEFKETFTAASRVSWSLFWQRVGTGGLSNGGSPELLNWAVRIKAFQEDELKENLERYAQWVIHADDFPYTSEFEDGAVEVKFNPLYPQSEKEDTETVKTRADSIVVLLNSGMSLEQIHQIEEGASLDSIGEIERPEEKEQAQSSGGGQQGQSAAKTQEKEEAKDSKDLVSDAAKRLEDSATEESQYWFEQQAIMTIADLEEAVRQGTEILPETFDRILESEELQSDL